MFARVEYVRKAFEKEWVGKYSLREERAQFFSTEPKWRDWISCIYNKYIPFRMKWQPLIHMIYDLYTGGYSDHFISSYNSIQYTYAQDLNSIQSQTRS